MCILNLNGNSSIEGIESSGALLRKFKEWTVLVSSFQQRKVESRYFLSYKFENTSSKYYILDIIFSKFHGTQFWRKTDGFLNTRISCVQFRKYMICLKIRNQLELLDIQTGWMAKMIFGGEIYYMKGKDRERISDGRLFSVSSAGG